jgi:serine/threonine protein kinase
MTMSEPHGTLTPGRIIAGRYELTEEVGRGGFGMVWRARQLNMDRDVAVKILPPRFLAIPDVVERFKREARLASRLRHPNTITLHDWGQSEDLLYIVMELLTGEDLADMLRSAGKFPPERALAVVRQVLKSLAEAHEQNIVHRDLKPENIFLSVVGHDLDVVKVLDFGIAKIGSPQAEDAYDEKHRSLTISGSTVGTPTYMSPEQAAGEDVDGQTDLYALGVIMYEMLDGRPPFTNRDPVKVMRAHLFEEVPPFRDPALQNTLLDRVVRKALAKDKGERFRSANEFLLALAADAVAKPVVFGLDLRSLEEPSTQEFVVGGQNTESLFDGPLNMQTLPFTTAASRIEDAIPFSNVPRKTPVPEKVRATETSSSLSDLLPPPGIATGSSASSILRIIEPSDEQDVIMLTKKVDDSAERFSTKPAKSGEHMVTARQSTPAPIEAWSWGEGANAAVEEEERALTGPHPAAVQRSRTWIWFALVLIIIGVAVAAVVLTPLGMSLGLH